MARIVQLSDELSNKIAAGEVVERPASVVKELVENAIDANSTVIEVELVEAGLTKIRIVDNGDGIENEDCLTAFRRHATSKIKNEGDLFRIRTLGFRGEALPSIASVSEVDLKTSCGDEAGTHLYLRGGEVVTHELYSSRKGTDITITNLFFNTPARLKYMKTINTELGNITDIMNRLALANPHISFKLMHHERKLLHTNGNGDVRQVLASIYGIRIAKNMIPIKASSLDYEVDGYIALPEVTRASRAYMSTVINGRHIKNFGLLKAITAGYHTLLPIGRYPIVFLNIKMDPLLVDVNVHPTKLEVRLSKEDELFSLVEGSIKKAFKKEQLIPEVATKAPVTKAKPQSEQSVMSFDYSESPSVKEERVVTYEKAPEPPPAEEPVKEDLSWLNELEQEEERKFNEALKPQQENFVEEKERVEEESTEEEESSSRVPTLYPIGQMHGTYILAQNENGLYIIDQHAAQERIKYEYFRDKLGEVEPEVQEMLVPITLEYSANEAIVVEEHREALASVGVFIESFGHNSFIVRSHPQWFPKGEEKETIEEMIEQVLSMRKVDIIKLREEAAIMMSCKGSIKANHHLRHDEIFALLQSLRASSDPFTCPHGRPIIVHYSTYEMEKMFKRVM
ncbi:DNA mismatch repair endonuclease MutL [Priestia endophytica]|uniref:DNA mismatch repair endonuclease MutL n=1 Tax=Priestia endophytica TaxID=135735 RepID=UPI000DCA770C|nr:DNA mismatch repair endonuclease MutL [Priestia endophytica]RAS76831.1 DNA mismatch repair protein MutL [Priestia endophytica]